METASLKLGVQETEDYRIFKGPASEFFDLAIIRFNNEQQDPERTPLESCPESAERVCSECIWVDGDKEHCKGTQEGDE